MAKSKTTPRKPTRDKGGRPSNGTTQRSIRMTRDRWDAVEVLVERLNSERDPLLSDKITVTDVVNMAVRDMFKKHGLTGRPASEADAAE